jgi:hypothetical protein
MNNNDYKSIELREITNNFIDTSNIDEIINANETLETGYNNTVNTLETVDNNADDTLETVDNADDTLETVDNADDTLETVDNNADDTLETVDNNADDTLETVDNNADDTLETGDNNADDTLETVDNNEKVIIYEQQVYNQSMDTIVTLMSGIKFTKSNWMLLLNKITTIVKGIKKIKENDVRIQLIYDLLMNYLDNHTNLSDDTIDFINKNAIYTCQFMLEKAGTNKKEHEKNTRKVIQQYKLYEVDTDSLINTLQITNLLVNKITVIIKSNDINIQGELPEIISMCVKVVDKFKHLTKAEKYSLIAQAIEEVLEKEVMSKLETNSPKYKTLKLLIINLPMMISTVTGIINGDNDFVEDLGPLLKRGWNKIKKVFKCCSKNTN